MFDVVIVGAGPAGTAAAFDLLDKGMKVLILDKVEFPRKKACAGGITPKGYHLFKYDISSMVKRECQSVRITSKKDKAFTISSKKTLCYMTNRQELDFFSLNKVMEMGAEFMITHKIMSIDESGSFVEIRTQSGNFKASYLIGADGANSIVRRFVTKKKFFKKQFAIEADVKIDRPDTFPMEFDFSWHANGYFWIFPKDDHLNIGIYSIDSNLKPNTQDLSDFARKRIGCDNLEAVKGYPICTGGGSYQFDGQSGSRRTLLVGDAAGFAEPLFGEGIYFAIKSGQTAAQAILRSGNEPDSVKSGYIKKLKGIQADLKLYDLSAAFFYRFPRISLKVASIPFIRERFARGYGNGDSLSALIFGRR
ncbi:MAG: geranylgeranyl reductase family protein [Pseudomonadota bacterium]